MKRSLSLAERAVREAGAAVMTFYRTRLSVRDKGNDNPVTPADLEADRILRKRLLESHPDYGWLSEETADSADRLKKNRVWVVDPIDGTKEFIKGLPEFAVSVGLVEKGRVILGVVYNPATEEMFTAANGVGASLNGHPIAISGTSSLDQAVMEASRTEFRGGRFSDIRKKVSRIDPIGSIAYKLARLAAGQSDIVFSFTPKSEWDLCGAAAIIEESGGKISLPNGDPLLFNRIDTRFPGVAATNGLLHDQLLNLIERG
jgi:myo-inositol-1(or 4)-monophosphatase